VVAIRVVTVLLGPEEIGRRELLLSLTSFFALLLISPVGNYLNRQAVEWHLEGRLLASLRRFAWFLAGVAAVAALVVGVLHATSGIGTPIGIGWSIWLVCGSLLVGTLTNQFNGLLNIIGYRGWYVLFANAASWLGLGLSVALVQGRTRDAESWMSGALLGQGLVLAGAVAVLGRLGQRPADAMAGTRAAAGFSFRSVFRFSAPLLVTTAFYWAQTNGYRFVLAGLADVRTIGLLTVGLTLASAPLAMFDTFFTDYYRPIFYQEIKFASASQKAGAWNRYASAYFPAILLMGVFVAAGGPFLARVLVSEAFWGVAWLAAWGAVLQCAVMAYSTYVALSFASLETSALIRPNLLGALTTISLMFLLAPRQPLAGTALAMTGGMIVTLVDTAVVLGRDLPHALPWARLSCAAGLAVPMIALFWLARSFWSTPSVLQSLGILLGTGVYLVVAQALMARPWLSLHKSSSGYAEPAIQAPVD
jgi:hypothetical protein